MCKRIQNEYSKVFLCISQPKSIAIWNSCRKYWTRVWYLSQTWIPWKIFYTNLLCVNSRVKELFAGIFLEWILCSRILLQSLRVLKVFLWMSEQILNLQTLRYNTSDYTLSEPRVCTQLNWCLFLYLIQKIVSSIVKSERKVKPVPQLLTGSLSVSEHSLVFIKTFILLAIIFH